MRAFPTLTRSIRGRLATRASAVIALCLALGALGAGVVFSQGRGGTETAAGAFDFQRTRMGMAHVGMVRTRGELVATRWLGSGFVVDRDCTVVTAKHIFERRGRESLVVRFLHPSNPDAVRTFSADLIYEDPESDVAFLRPGGQRLAKQLCRSQISPLSVAETFDPAALTGRDVVVAGFPVLEGEQPRDVPIFRKGIVASSELQWEGAPMLLLDLTGVPGFSGSPVLLEDEGTVVGLVYGPGRTERLYDFEWATPFSRETLGRMRAARENAR